MDKNVSGVDLDELLKAREELNKEIGVETDPNMYSDYNPNRKNEEDKSALDESSEVSVTVNSDTETLSSESSDSDNHIVLENSKSDGGDGHVHKELSPCPTVVWSIGHDLGRLEEA